MKSIRSMSQSELAAYVQTHLRSAGIDVVLSGGASVAYYSEYRYVSLDIDLVNQYFANRSKLTGLMIELGFIEEGRYFTHPESEYWVEFPSGPLAVGREPVKEIRSVTLSTGVLRVISPTDCIKDRLLAYFYWDDLQCLEQAALIADIQQVDWSELERWAIVEGCQQKFIAIMPKINPNPK